MEGSLELKKWESSYQMILDQPKCGGLSITVLEAGNIGRGLIPLACQVTGSSEGPTCMCACKCGDSLTSTPSLPGQCTRMALDAWIWGLMKSLL